MTVAAFLSARGWRPHTFGSDWWQVLVPIGRGCATPVYLLPGEIGRLAEDLGWEGA